MCSKALLLRNVHSFLICLVLAPNFLFHLFVRFWHFFLPSAPFEQNKYTTKKMTVLIERTMLRHKSKMQRETPLMTRASSQNCLLENNNSSSLSISSVLFLLRFNSLVLRFSITHYSWLCRFRFAHKNSIVPDSCYKRKTSWRERTQSKNFSSLKIQSKEAREKFLAISKDLTFNREYEPEGLFWFLDDYFLLKISTYLYQMEFIWHFWLISSKFNTISTSTKKTKGETK